MGDGDDGCEGSGEVGVDHGGGGEVNLVTSDTVHNSKSNNIALARCFLFKLTFTSPLLPPLLGFRMVYLKLMLLSQALVSFPLFFTTFLSNNFSINSPAF